jgi:ATP/ADP translocase
MYLRVSLIVCPPAYLPPLRITGFGLAINFTDILWKSMVKMYFSDVLEYQRFMGNYSTVVGYVHFIFKHSNQ